MNRCIELATLGSGYVAPNPMVGAILVHQNRIIGEGWHQKYGEAHAEVNCIDSVKEADKPLIAHSTLYISLEPCTHFGKTPPCTNLIIEQKIQKVVIGCSDPNVAVSGGGIKKLQAAGLKVESGILEKQCKELNKRFFTFHTLHRPYVVLKWAQTTNKKISSGKKDRLLITNEITNRLVHKWRSEESSILVGTNTALLDNPELTNRYWEGPSPIRLVIDMDIKLPSSLNIFNQKVSTIIFNTKMHSEEAEWSSPFPKERVEVRPLYYKIKPGVSLVHGVINALFLLKIQSILVEGGAKLLQSFIDEEMWDEARIVKSSELRVQSGLDAPQLQNAFLTKQQTILSDKVEIFRPFKG